MDRFGNILLVYSESPGFRRALDRAILLARRDRAYLTIAKLEASPLKGVPTLPGSLFRSPPPDTGRRRGSLGIDGAVERALEQGVATRTITLEGKPHTEVVRHAVNHRHDLVIVLDAPCTALPFPLSHNPASRIMRECPCPVWIMKPGSEVRIRRIVAALETGEAEGVPEDVDKSVLSFARQIAVAEGCDMDIVHAWDFRGRDLETSRSELLPPMRRDLYRRNEAAQAQALDETLSRIDLSDVSHQVHLLKGDPFEVLLDFSEGPEIDLIVAGTVSRAGIGRLAHGNMVERILPLVPCSIVAIKPFTFAPALEKVSTARAKGPFAFGYRTGMTSGTFSERTR